MEHPSKHARSAGGSLKTSSSPSLPELIMSSLPCARLSRTGAVVLRADEWTRDGSVPPLVARDACGFHSIEDTTRRIRKEHAMEPGSSRPVTDVKRSTTAHSMHTSLKAMII